MQIKVTQDSALKPSAEPVANLSEDQIVRIGRGSLLSLASYEQRGDHLVIELDPALTDLEALGGRGKWWVPGAHLVDPEGYQAGLHPLDQLTRLQGMPGDEGDRGFRFVLPGGDAVLYSNEGIHPACPNITGRELLHFDGNGNYRRPPDEKAVQRLLNLTKALQEIRNRFGKRLHIVSGLRTAEVNSAIGGSPCSRHLLGDACDFTIEGMQLAEVYADLDLWWGARGGLGLAVEYIHLDCRGWRARWSYQTPSSRPLQPLTA